MGRGQHGNHLKGPKHLKWSDKKMVSTTGYIKVRVGKGHPLADPNGYAYEHLVVWVAAGNPRPPKGWLIHHQNGNKHDNRIENLVAVSRGDHNRELWALGARMAELVG